MTERVLPLEGGRNFRDMGGYPAADGRRLKWKRLFRSGSMVGLTEADYERLAGLGVRAMVDLRSTHEREASPHDWERIRATAYWARDYDMSLGDLSIVIASEAPTGQDARAAMASIYRRLPFEQAPSYRELFRRLAAEETPLVFNCSAGKDRTGIAAALVLSALGAEREVIMEDYLLTNTAYHWRRSYADLTSLAARLPPALVEATLGVDETYLHAAFAAVEESHGSVAAYLREALDVTPQMVEQMRAHLLE